MPRTDPNRFTRVTVWIEKWDTRKLMDALADDLLPSVRVVRVVHNQQLPTDEETKP